MRVRLSLLLIPLMLILMLPSASIAERFAELYFGRSFTQDERVTLQTQNTRASGEVDFDDSFIGGYRMGWWFERAPWLGLALEASYFKHDINGGDLSVLPITPLLMLRIPIGARDHYPKGEWQPYVAVGPGIFYSKLELCNNYKDERFDIGLDARAGIKKMFLHNFGAFVEYRYTTFNPSYDFPIVDDFDVETHHVFVGISVNF
jgi:opacity protein-like surface antigen